MNAETMPEPVPAGRFAEYAAAISEGFCPWCRVPFGYSFPPCGLGPRGHCYRCGSLWHLGPPQAVTPVITWTGATGPDWQWTVHTYDDGWKHADAIAYHD